MKYSRFSFFVNLLRVIAGQGDKFKDVKQMSKKLHRTRFEGLGYIHQDKNLWRVVDVHDGMNTVHVVGPQYRSQAELLGDLDRYAKETWGY